MADIFVSYARDDRAFAEAVARALSRFGWSVWWDRKIPVGMSFSEVIERELESARCVVVVWSHASIASEWVVNEAAEGARRKVLIPIRIEDVRPPFEFRRIHAATLDRDMPEMSAEFDECVAAIKTIIARTHSQELQNVDVHGAIHSKSIETDPANDATEQKRRDSTKPDNRDQETPTGRSQTNSPAQRRRVPRSEMTVVALVVTVLLAWNTLAPAVQKLTRRPEKKPVITPASVSRAPASTAPTSETATNTVAKSAAQVPTAPSASPLQSLVGTWQGRVRPSPDNDDSPQLELKLTMTAPAELTGSLITTWAGGSSSTDIIVTAADNTVRFEMLGRQIWESDGSPARQGDQWDGREYHVRWLDVSTFELADQDGIARYSYTGRKPN
jgi:TIR domain